jgi:lysophospholipase L1-like esterase
LIVLAGGVNDFRGDKPLGALADCYTTPYSANPRKTDSDITNATFYGAFYRAVYAALTKFPNAKLCVVTPYNNPESKYGNHLESPAATPGWPKYNTPNAGGKVLHDYVMAMKQVASMFGIPAADVNAESGINFATDKRYLTDGIHCTAAGGQVMAKVIFSKIMGTEYFFN